MIELAFEKVKVAIDFVTRIFYAEPGCLLWVIAALVVVAWLMWQ